MLLLPLLRRCVLLLGLCAACLNTARGAWVYGLLSDVSGAPLSNVTVRAEVFDSILDPSMETVTDASGRFIFSGPAGWWFVTPSSPYLNALGYLDVPASSLTVSNRSLGIRFTTRKLDLSQRLIGSVLDEQGMPLTSFPLRGVIVENGQRYETNTSTGVDGKFFLAVSPALWRIEPQYFAPTTVVFPETDIPVEATNAQTSITLVAPQVSAYIAGSASNLAGFEIVAEAEAHGHRYRRSTQVWDQNTTFSLGVFPGLWTVTVTNSGFGRQPGRVPPPPVILEVTNGWTDLRLVGSPYSAQSLTVRTLTAAGDAVTNASVYGYNGSFVFSSPPRPPPSPLPTTNVPGATSLQLGPGRWTINASISGPSNQWTWQVGRDVVMTDSGPSNLNLVLPIPGGLGPRILGTVRSASGTRQPGMMVTLQALEAGTNYGAWVFTDALGEFAMNVVPGRWLVSLLEAVPCPTVATAVVTTADQQVELTLNQFTGTTNLPLSVSAFDEGGYPERPFQINFSRSGTFATTNAYPGEHRMVPLGPGLWSASLSAAWEVFRNDPYEIFPAVKFHHGSSSPAALQLVTRKASARIEGRLRDSGGRLLTRGYASAWANIQGTNYTVSGELLSGYFSLNVIPGDWEIGVSSWRYPGDDALAAAPLGPGAQIRPLYRDPARKFIHVTNGVNRCEFVADPISIPLVPLSVQVIREDGSLVDDVIIRVSELSVGGWSTTATGGHSEFTVLPGPLTLSVYWHWRALPWEGLIFPSMQLEAAAPSNHVVLVARAASAALTGTVSNAFGHSLPISILANTTVNGTNYSATGCPTITGEIRLPVFPGTWQVNVTESQANDLGYRSGLGETVTVPEAGQTPNVQLLLQPFEGDFREAHWIRPSLRADGAVELELRAQAGLKWRVDRSTDLTTWTPWATIITSNGMAHIVDEAEASGGTFYRAAWLR